MKRSTITSGDPHEVIEFLTEQLKQKDSKKNFWLHIPSPKQMKAMRKYYNKPCPACNAHCIKVEIDWSSGIFMGMTLVCINDCGWEENITEY